MRQCGSLVTGVLMCEALPPHDHVWCITVVIQQPLRPKQSFSPEDIEVLSRAFEDAVRELRLDRADPATHTLAKRLIEIAEQGVRDPVRLRDAAVKRD